MFRLIFCAAFIFFCTTVNSQLVDSSQENTANGAYLSNSAITESKKKFDLNLLKKYPADHLIFKWGYDNWVNTNDSNHPSGFNNHFNLAFMYNKFFKSNPNFSIAFGGGFGWNNAYFNDRFVDIKANSPKLQFTNILDGKSNNYDVFRLQTFSFQAPVEIRYYSNLKNLNKSWKFAIGATPGLLLRSFVNIKNPKTASGVSIYGSNYRYREFSTKYFNNYSVELTARAGWSFFGLHYSYLVTDIFASGTTPGINRYSLGLFISGL